MSKLLDKLKKSGSVKHSEILSDSLFFTDKDVIPTQLPILNIAFSGSLDGGLVPGLSILSGFSKTFKTLGSLYCLKAYFDKYPEAVCLFYDSEFGSTTDSLKSFGIDSSRVIHIPIEHVEQLKFDIVKRLEQIERGDRVFILVDSLGALASKKEVDDAVEEKSVADMSRAKSIRSLLRIITPHLTMKDIPCIMINHVYLTMEMYAKTVQPGGTAVTYSANQIFVITKSQEKDGTELSGWNFTITIDKSRYVKEKSKLTFTVNYDQGISKWSGLMDIALEAGVVIKPSNGWYQKVCLESGEVIEGKYRLKDTNSKDFWGDIIESQKFKDFVCKKYKLSNSKMIQDEISSTDISNTFDIVDLD